jgi:hypothetical protein
MKQAEIIPEFTTISEASRFTGMNPKTIKKRVAGLSVSHTLGTNNFYMTKEVLRNAYVLATDAEKSKINLTEEKAWYYRELTEKVRIEKEKMASNLLDADQMMIVLAKKRLAVKERLMNLAYTLAPRIPGIRDKQKAFDLLQLKFEEILQELADEGFNEHSGKDKK